MNQFNFIEPHNQTTLAAFNTFKKTCRIIGMIYSITIIALALYYSAQYLMISHKIHAIKKKIPLALVEKIKGAHHALETAVQQLKSIDVAKASSCPGTSLLNSLAPCAIRHQIVQTSINVCQEIIVLNVQADTMNAASDFTSALKQAGLFESATMSSLNYEEHGARHFYTATIRATLKK